MNLRRALSVLGFLKRKDFHHDAVHWRADWKVEKFRPEDDPRINPFARPYEVLTHRGNLLMYGGASCLWETLIGNGTATAGQALTYFNNANAALGVGDSTTAAAATQTDLQAATNKIRQAMDATYPTHTDGTASGNATITFKATFGNTTANFAWQELAVFNSATAGVGRMLNRLVQSFGTKASGNWSMSLALTLS